MSTITPKKHFSHVGWIISPFIDLTCLVGAPLMIVPLLWVGVRYFSTPQQLWLATIAFASLGHHLPGFMRAYGDRELFQRFFWRFLLAPPLFMAASYLFALRGLNGLELILLFWATWHGMMQTYGFMRIYDLKLGNRSATAAWLDWALCSSIFVVGIVFSDSRVGGLSRAAWQCGAPLFGPEWLTAMRWATGATALMILAIYIGRMAWSWRCGEKVSWLKIGLALSTCWLYWLSGAATTNILIGAAMFEIFHAVQYDAVVWTYNRRLFDRTSRSFGLLGGLFQNRHTFLFIYMGAIFGFGALRFLATSPGETTGQTILFTLLSTSSFLHFYFDGFIWKVSQRATGVNLNLQGGAGESKHPFRLGLAHLGKCAVLAALAGGLFMLETDQGRAGDGPEIERQLALLTPEMPEIRIRAGMQAREAGDLERALAIAKSAVAQRPYLHVAHAELGATLQAMGLREEATAAFREAVRLGPQVWRNHYDLAQSLVALQRWPEAEQSFKEAVRRRPAYWKLRHDFGLFFVRQKKYDAAIRQFRQALAADPHAFAPQQALAEAMLAKGDVENAIRTARSFAEASPQEGAVWRNYAIALMARGDFPKAIAFLQRALQLGPDDTVAGLKLATAFEATSDFKAAARQWEALLAKHPQNTQVLFGAALLTHKLGDLAKAIRLYERCVAIDSHHTQALNNLGAAFFEQHDWVQAAEAYQRVLAFNASDAEANYNLGLLYLTTGQREAALRHVRLAVELGLQPSSEVAEALSLGKTRDES